jgi:hypothetical protein
MKIRSLLFFAFSFLFINHVNSQTYIVYARPHDFPFWRYYNLKGEIIINLGEQKDCHQFTSDGVAMIGDGKYFLINRRGERIATQTLDKLIRLKDYKAKAPVGSSDGLIIAGYIGPA